ncbi:hypothetical protein B0H65DRAFT_570261, partial [Neurospora tetraspora]
MMDLSKHLSIKELPTTYREGIFVSLALGISYIWIDSLCIIQDDEEDWSKEAAMMKDVATAAADSSQSNFRDRDPEIIPPLEVTVSDWKWEEPGQSKFWLAIKWVDMRREDIVYSPLHSRAWVFQEASLSRRRIDLARTQMWGRLVERILDSQVPKWPNDKSIKGLTNAKVDNYDFDESWDVRDSKTPHLRPPRVSYLEHPQGRPDQRKEGVVDGAVRKSIRFNTLDELSEHVRLFILPIVANTRTKVAICLMLCQTLDDSFAGNNIYQRVGTYWWCLSRWSVEDLEPVPERDVYII